MTGKSEDEADVRMPSFHIALETRLFPNWVT